MIRGEKMSLISGTSNPPVLPTGWQAVNYAGTNQDFTAAPSTAQGSTGWKYNYDPVNTVNGVGPKQWANAKDTKGNLWVWIPRFTYKIGVDPTMDVKFSAGTTDDTLNTFKTHTAFNFGGTQLTGFWVQKYQAYQDTANGNIPGSKPGLGSWRSISVNDIFNACRNMQSSITTAPSAVDSHMMKNGEYGAVAILAYAVGQGRPKINGDTSFRTGYTTGGTVGVAGSLDTTGETSTSGNVTGVFDMVGCGYVYVASYVNNGNANLTTYCAALVNADAKYKDVFPIGTSDGQAENYAAAAATSGGMMLNETSTAGTGTTGWLNWAGTATSSNFPCSSVPVFIRGGDYANSYSGLAYFNGTTGNAGSNFGFRACFVNLDSAPLISGTDTNLGDLSAPPSITYQVSDADNDAVNITEKLNTTVLRTLNNAPKNTDITLTITSAQWTALAINTQHSITITADDGRGGITTRTYTFRRVNAAPGITGTDGSIGDKNAPFTYTYQITDADGDTVNVIERFNGQAIRTLNNVALGVDQAVTIDSAKLASVPINGTATISIEATDSAGNASYRNVTFRRVNSAAVVVSASPADLGARMSAPTVTYQVSDPEGDSITVTESLNGTVLRTISPATPNTDLTVTIPADKWITLGLVQHTITIRATDSNGAYSERVFTFTRADDRAEVEMLNALETTAQAVKIVPSINAIMPTGSILTVEVCNNGFDANPTWEDATTATIQRKAYTFTNTVKTADKWGIKMRVTLARGTATGECSIMGYGAAFE